MRVWSTSELYPPETPVAVRELIDGLLTASRDLGGRVFIRRALAATERELLSRRRAELEPWTSKSASGEIRAIVAPMLSGFGVAEKDLAERSSAVATQIAGLPAWAAKRACDRFTCGLVKPEEIGIKPNGKREAPTPRHVYLVAHEFLKPVTRELHRIGELALGVPRAPEPTPAERARTAEAIAVMHEDFKTRMARQHISEVEDQAYRRQRWEAEAENRNRDARRRDYIDAGIVAPDPVDGIIPSLPMMLKMGYTIQEFPGGRNSLVPPLHQRANTKNRETRIDEMGR